MLFEKIVTFASRILDEEYKNVILNMNISLDKTTPVSAVITLQMERADYEADVTKAIKNFCHKAQIPGFRPGKVPFGMAKKLYGGQAKMEVTNKLLSDNLFSYIREQKINILGEPLPNEHQETQDIEKQDSFEFKFDIALAPEFKITLNGRDSIDYYDIEVSDDQIDQQVKALTQQAGHPEDVEEYQDGDILRGLLAELGEDGQPLEGGVQVEKASLMPQYMKDDAQKKIFDGAKKNDVLTFNPAAAYGDTELASLLHLTKEESENHKGNFSFQVDEIGRYVPAELNQEFFDQIFGKDTVKSEEEFRTKVKEQIAKQHEADSDYKFFLDVRAHAEKKVGDLEFPNDLLKRIMLANNKDKDSKFVDEHFDDSIKELKWHLIKEQLAEANKIKVEDKDVKATALEAARFQFAQYGMANIPDEYLEQYAQQMLKDKNQVNSLVERAIDQKLTAALKSVVKLKHKTISQEDFGKLFEKSKD